jgi:hypothetical protein
MKSTILLFIMFFLAAMPRITNAQNYIFEVNPKFFSSPSTNGYGISIDADFFLSRSFSLGVCIYGDLNNDFDNGNSGVGLNLGLSSARQRKFVCYGNVKNVFTQSAGGLGELVLGGGGSYRLNRRVNFNILELNYFLVTRSLFIESGLVFKMIRKE